MGSRPPSLRLLLLTTLLLIWPCARGQSSYIIDTVGLTILPKSTVQTGTAVSLRCQAIVSRSNISQLPYHFQITRDDSPVQSFDTVEDSVEYELNPARAGDSGSYECRVTVKDRSKASIRHKLEVTGLQTPTLNLTNTQPYENEEFTATCSAPEEKGNFIFRFYRRFRSGESEKIKPIPTQGNSAETTLSLKLRGECFLSCDYEMTLASGTRRSNVSNEIRMNVKALTITPVINMLPGHTVYEGDVVEAVCKVVDSPLKNIHLFLTKERTILKEVTATALSHRFTAQDGDSGELVCKAAWENVHKESYLTIKVKELFSKPDLTLEPVIDLFEGTRFTLNCSVSIYVPNRITKKALKFFIYKDDVKLTSSKIYSTLAHPAKNGNYTCKVQVDIPNHTLLKESQKLVVAAKIPVSKPVLTVVGRTLLLGKPFQVLCQSDRGTLPITYALHGPNRSPEYRTVSRPQEKAIFNSTAIFKSLDLSKFLCHANNAQRGPPMIGQGEQMLHTTNIIESVSRPVLMVHPGKEDISEGHSMLLVCSVERGSPPLNFTWYQIGKTVLSSLTSNNRKESYRINTVGREHSGSYFCMSTNPAGEVKQSSTVTIAVKWAGWKKGLIAVFCILLILTLILVIAFKTRLLHCKRKRTGRLSVKSTGTKVERLSLTQAEVNEAANATPGMMGKSVWSDRVSGSESDDQSSAITADKPEPQYTEVQTREADPNRAPVKEGTETVYSKVCHSQQGVPELPDGVSVEYAQLNHDADQPGDQLPTNHGGHSPNSDHVMEINNSVCIDTGDQGEGNCD
ncbi:platelet endothelial cell adhesion molecule isoform X2 [Cololabis saira]|uniref:platelet endothelial cell adhesion molecule isoform X2 n=1 Tax=Cololabis saira TaxID=129043 RepID=UPI002AD57DD4|nr:platelet endothelial cell adhesion molecule isoform X2 [Cololabis saira]